MRQNSKSQYEIAESLQISSQINLAGHQYTRSKYLPSCCGCNCCSVAWLAGLGAPVACQCLSSSAHMRGHVVNGCSPVKLLTCQRRGTSRAERHRGGRTGGGGGLAGPRAIVATRCRVVRPRTCLLQQLLLQRSSGEARTRRCYSVCPCLLLLLPSARRRWRRRHLRARAPRPLPLPARRTCPVVLPCTSKL